MRLEDFSWPEVAELIARDPVVVVPIGAIEQHGKHLPLQVDATLCAEVARRAAESAVEGGATTVVTPTLWAGYSPHHMDFPGTFTLTATTFVSMLTDVTNSLHHHGFRRILILNGHGGNANLLRSTVQTLRFECGIEVVGASYWDFGATVIDGWRKSPLGGINHACEMETSLMLAIRPDLVEMEKAEDMLLTRNPYLGSDLTSGGVVSNAQPFAELTSHGVLGMPTNANAERGKQLLEALVAEVVKFIVDYSKWENRRSVTP